MPQASSLVALTRRLMLACLAMLSTLSLAGCGGSEEDPITAQADQFEVGDDEPSKPASVNVTDLPASSDTGDASSDPAGEASPPSTEPPAAPQFDPLAIPDANQLPDDETQLLAMLGILQSRQPEGRTQQEMLENYVRIQHTRIKAAEKLWSVAAESEAKISAVQSKLDALRILVLAGAPGVAEQMQTYCQNLQSNENPEIAFYGRLMLFGTKIDRLANQEAVDTAVLMDELKTLARDAKDNPGAYTVISQAARVLQEVGQREAAIEAYSAIGEAFKDSKDPQLVTEAKAMLERVRILEAGLDSQMQALLMGETDDETSIVETINTLLAGEGIGAGTLAEVAQAAMFLEVTQHFETAAQVYQSIVDTYETNSDPELSKQAVTRAGNGLKRVALIGKPLVVTGATLEGTPFDWSAYQGKVVLVDFWATWCGPCLAEMPNIAHAYSQYKDRGFEVVGISLDDDIQTVKQFTDVQPLPWTVVMSEDPEKQGFENPLAVRCGIESIPFIALIGRDGNVAALHTRGPQLQEKVKELLGPLDAAEPSEQPTADPSSAEVPAAKTPAAVPPATVPATPAESEVPAAEAPVQPPAGEQSRHLERYPEFYFVAIEEADVAADSDLEEAQDEVNLYSAGEGLSPEDLVDFIFDMQDKPRSIQGRPGFGEALIEAADRILAADAPDKFQRIAAETKFQILHDRACLDDEAADAALVAFVEQMKDHEDPKIAKQVKFFQWERRAINADELALEDVPKLLAELKEYLKDQDLAAQHLRLASSMVHAINRLEGDEDREKYFQEFGGLFAKSKSKELARYGKKLAKKPETKMGDLVGKPMELAGVTEMGAPLDWDSYRGKVVLVDFWATWCGPCRAAMPQVKALYDERHDQGFEVVGVSLDKDPAKMGKYLEDNGIPWTNVVGDEAKEFAEKYGVRGIPTMILVDRKGNIVSADHKLETLIPHIDKLLKPAA